MPISDPGSILDKQVGKPICKCPAACARAVAATAQVHLQTAGSGVVAAILTPILLR